ncbi:hypothetical protein KIN20_031636 [Parelaphostrongylus tenuis]|uniref:Uncharacterized protein n=1 Tax=Parelaphostrongylus tenuis TaxID=148309 RepID=A0AAD5R5S9_PARTN|nr:hypothetical protein KIN20_031636 [Parelaphostrongylus tenuis]
MTTTRRLTRPSSTELVVASKTKSLRAERKPVSEEDHETRHSQIRVRTTVSTGRRI